MGSILSYKAPSGSNYSSQVNRIVQKSTTDEVLVTTAATVLPFGIIYSGGDNMNGGCVSVQTSGPAKAIAGNTLTVGTTTALMSDDQGRCIAATAGSYAIGYYAGKRTAAVGDLIDIVIGPFQMNS